jgi:hypothetical protein
VFNQLALGESARVRIANNGTEYKGSVIHLTGLASPPENLAIQPASLAREAYRVTVAVPGIRDACMVGRSGSVVFSPSGNGRGRTAGLSSRLAGLLDWW